MDVKRLREGDRLSNIPESLQLCIISFLDTKHAVETSMLSTSWVSSWTCVPVLNFNSDSFQRLHVFNNFVLNVLEKRQPVKLDRLAFKCAHEPCNTEMLKKVIDYALLHDVEELEASIECWCKHWIWPIWSSDSLTSLKLKSRFSMSCSLMEPRSSGSFNNLAILHLERVLISDLDPFSRFPVLDKLRLTYCYIKTNGKALNVHALQLSEFTIYCGHERVNQCEFTTPKLRYFEWSGSFLPRLKAHLPVVDMAVIGYNCRCVIYQEKIMFDNLLMMLDTLHAAKSLTLSAHTIHLLTLFPMNVCSSFRDLKCLNMDFRAHTTYISSKFLNETLKLIPGVKTYLLHKSLHDVKCTIISPNGESSCSISRTQPARYLD